MVAATSLGRLLRLSASVKVLIRPFLGLKAKINATQWNSQYKRGCWDYLDSFADGAEVLLLVEEYAPEARILDLGCGTSANLPLTPGRYQHYQGVDISSVAIKRGRALRRPNTSFEVADILTYDTAERYDAILLREVLYYFAPQEAAELLRRLASLLRPDGRIFVQLYPDAVAEFADVVRNCGLRVLEERARKPDGTSQRGVFIVLAPV